MRANRAVALLWSVCSIALLSGCGLKGDLYLEESATVRDASTKGDAASDIVDEQPTAPGSAGPTSGASPVEPIPADSLQDNLDESAAGDTDEPGEEDKNESPAEAASGQ